MEFLIFQRISPGNDQKLHIPYVSLSCCQLAGLITPPLGQVSPPVFFPGTLRASTPVFNGQNGTERLYKIFFSIWNFFFPIFNKPSDHLYSPSPFFQNNPFLFPQPISSNSVLLFSDGEKPDFFQSPCFGLYPGFEINYPGFADPIDFANVTPN